MYTFEQDQLPYLGFLEICKNNPLVSVLDSGLLRLKLHFSFLNYVQVNQSAPIEQES